MADIVHATLTVTAEGGTDQAWSSVLQRASLSDHQPWQGGALLTSKLPLSFWVACRTRF